MTVRRCVTPVYVDDGNRRAVILARAEDKMGCAASRRRKVSFATITTFPAGNRWLKKAQGFKYAMMGLDGGPFEHRRPVPWGLRRPALTATLNYIGRRKALGKNLSTSVQRAYKFCLAEMGDRTSGARVC